MSTNSEHPKTPKRKPRFTREDVRREAARGVIEAKKMLGEPVPDYIIKIATSRPRD